MAKDRKDSTSKDKKAESKSNTDGLGPQEGCFCSCGAGPGRHTYDCPYNPEGEGPEDSPMVKPS